MIGMFCTEDMVMGRHELALLTRLEREYTPEIAREVLKPLIAQTSAASLRAIDWCVTNWSKKNNVVCSSLTPGKLTNVHQAYRITLAHWKRRLFDPFRRRGRLSVIIDGETYETTLGQANFTLWCYLSGVYNYVLLHLEEIEADMNSVSFKQKQRRRAALSSGVRSKRSELTNTPPCTCVAYMAPQTVTFGNGGD